jgi:hypothetical protein
MGAQAAGIQNACRYGFKKSEIESRVRVVVKQANCPYNLRFRT